VGWIGDGNNMAHSWIEAAATFGFELTLACPSGYTPDLGILAKARERGGRIVLTEDPELAARGAHYLHTDLWASMGQEAEQLRREAAFEGYQLNDRLMALARPGCKVMHCLPAHRGEEISDEVFEANADMIFDEAENRLHMQKAILEWVFEVL
jgi:ornithine carbamoyltransferase